jgi:Alpha/beta hydrolase family
MNLRLVQSSLPSVVGFHGVVPLQPERLQHRVASSASRYRAGTFVSQNASSQCATTRIGFPLGRRRVPTAVTEITVGSEGAALSERVFQTFMWRGHAINYRASGPPNGQQVLLVHGFGASIQHWRNNWSVLEGAGCRVFALDLLGFGASAKPDLGIGGYCLELWRDLCVDFIREYGRKEDQFVLIGNSIGSLVSLMTAVELPERVKGLCLIACAGGMVPFRRSELNFAASCLLWLVTTVLFNKCTGPVLFRSFRARESVVAAVTQAYAGAADAINDELLVRSCAFSHFTGTGL